ncbi:glycosyltransferase family 4 protein [Roseibium sp.]|uniref:glycosyltransferase family 4 protein n=1 Tax=Roseibium sp. TaxID=1936156 RepID=UPI003BB125F6
MNIFLFCSHPSELPWCIDLAERLRAAKGSGTRILFFAETRGEERKYASQLRENAARIPFDNIYPTEPRNLFRKFFKFGAKNRLTNSIVQFFSEHIEAVETVVVQLDDSHPRAKSVATVCRNLSIPRLLVAKSCLPRQSGSEKACSVSEKWGSTAPEKLIVPDCETKQKLLNLRSFSDATIEVSKVVSADAQQQDNFEFRLSAALDEIKLVRGRRIDPDRLPQRILDSDRFRQSSVVVFGTSFGSHIGVGKPVREYFRNIRDQQSKLKLQLVLPKMDGTFLERLATADIIVLNSFDILRVLKESTIKKLGRIFESSGKKLYFYCHETDFAYSNLAQKYPKKTSLFVEHVLPKAHVLAVSEAQSDWLQQFGSRSITVVYNCISRHKLAGFEHLQVSGPPNIVMVGSQQPRKGVELFSRVADIAASRGDPWNFTWLGAGRNHSANMYRSKNVNWVGHVSENKIAEWLAEVDVFFLSSVDDPFPLSVGEALWMKKPCVLYENTGFAKFVEDKKFGAVFHSYQPEQAYACLNEVLRDRESFAIDRAAVEELISEDNFVTRMLMAIHGSEHDGPKSKR